MAGKDVTVRVLTNLLDRSDPKAIQRVVHEVLEDLVEETADAVADEWRRRAPVDEGDYRDSIHVEDGKHDLQKIVAADADRDGVPYPIIYEYGSDDQPPRPVARQVANRHRKTYSSKAARKIKEATD